MKSFEDLSQLSVTLPPVDNFDVGYIVLVGEEIDWRQVVNGGSIKACCQVIG